MVNAKTAARVVTQLDFLPLSELLEVYLNDKAASVEASTIEAKRRAVTLFTDWHAGDPEITEISRRTCGQFVSDVLASNGRAPKTNRDTVGVLHAFFEWAIRKGRYELANPWKGLAEDLKGSRRGRYSDRKERAWTADEIKATLNGLPDTDIRQRLVLIGLHTGMRLNEICHLHSDYVDLKAGMFTLTEGKTDNAVRQVPIHPAIKDTVSALLVESSDEYLFSGLKPAGRDKKRGHSVGRRVNRWLRDNVTKDAGVPMRTTRNTFMNACENAGVPELTTQLIVGHARQSLTYGLYSPGVNFKLLREAVEKVSFA